MNGISGTGGTRLSRLSCPSKPGIVSPSGKHGALGSGDWSQSVAPCEASHPTGCRAVMLTTKLVSCQPGMHGSNGSQGFSAPMVYGSQIVPGALRQCPLVLM